MADQDMDLAMDLKSTTPDIAAVGQLVQQHAAEWHAAHDRMTGC